MPDSRTVQLPAVFACASIKCQQIGVAVMVALQEQQVTEKCRRTSMPEAIFKRSIFIGQRALPYKSPGDINTEHVAGAKECVKMFAVGNGSGSRHATFRGVV